jgi:hypothetical protein
LKQKLHTASTCTDKPMPDGPKHFITCHTNNARGHRRTARIEPAQFRTKKKDCSEWNRDREPPVRGEKARGHGPSSPRASSLAGHRPLILRPRSSGTKAAGPARSRSLRLPPRGHDEQCVARNPRTKRTGRSTRGGEPERPRQIGGGRRGGGCGRGGPSAPCRPASGGGRDRGWPVGPACQRGGNGAGRRGGDKEVGEALVGSDIKDGGEDAWRVETGSPDGSPCALWAHASGDGLVNGMDGDVVGAVRR